MSNSLFPIGSRVVNTDTKQHGRIINAHAPNMRAVRWDDCSVSPDVFTMDLEVET